jgi:hypothetical protein
MEVYPPGFAQQPHHKSYFLCKLRSFCAVVLLCSCSVGCGSIEGRLKSVFATRLPVGIEVAKTGHVGLFCNDILVVNFAPTHKIKFFVPDGMALMRCQGFPSLYFDSYPKRSISRNDYLTSESLNGVNAEIWFGSKVGKAAYLFKFIADRNDLTRSSTRILDANFAFWNMCRRSEQLDISRFFCGNPNYPRTFGIDNSLSIQEGRIGTFLRGIGGSPSRTSLLSQVSQSSESSPDCEHGYDDQCPIRPERISPFRQWAFWRLLLGFPLIVFGGWLRLRNRWKALSFITFLLGGCLLFGPRLPEQKHQQKQRDYDAITHGR